MNILIVILLAIIAYILWGIYRQKEYERIEKLEKGWEDQEKEKFKNYPHLYGKLEDNWLEVFAGHAERKLPLLKIAFMLYVQETTRIDFSEGAFKWDKLWDLSEELLEHLEKFHEGSVVEHEIALCTYWQIAAEAMAKLTNINSEVEGSKVEVEPYTNIEKILELFPTKPNHPEKELVFRDENGKFPRESAGSEHIKSKLRALGL